MLTFEHKGDFDGGEIMALPPRRMEEYYDSEVMSALDKMREHLSNIGVKWLQDDVQGVDDGICKLMEHTHDVQEKWRQYAIRLSYKEC